MAEEGLVHGREQQGGAGGSSKAAPWRGTAGQEGASRRELLSLARCVRACVWRRAREREGWGSSAGGITRVTSGARLGLGPA